MIDYQDIRVVIAAGIGTVTINRPPANTVRPQTLAEIMRAVDALVADAAVGAIVLRAEGRHFSAGADFGFLDEIVAGMPPAEIKASIYAHFQGAARSLYRCPKPTVALVQGAAVTVGCELALACDVRILADDAFLQESWIKLGIMPPLGGCFLLPRLVGLGRAMDMVLRAIPVKAVEAERIGLASEVVARDALDARGAELAGELAAMAPLAYAAAKQALHRGLETSMDAEWQTNVLNQAILLGSEDFREGLAAVKARRAPVFSGR